MNDSDPYKDLNLSNAKAIAKSWVLQYPTIKKIYLYQGVLPRYNYVIIAETFQMKDLDGLAEYYSNEGKDTFKKTHIGREAKLKRSYRKVKNSEEITDN